MPDRPLATLVEDLEELGVNRRLAPRDLHDVGRAFVGDDPVEHAFDLIHRSMRRPLGAAGGEAGRAAEIAVVRDLEDADAPVLFVVGADAAVVRAPVPERRVVFLDLLGILEEDLAARSEVRDVVRQEDSLLPVLGAALPEIDFVVLDQLLRVAQDEAFGAESAGHTVEEVGSLATAHALECTPAPTRAAVRSRKRAG